VEAWSVLARANGTRSWAVCPEPGRWIDESYQPGVVDAWIFHRASKQKRRKLRARLEYLALRWRGATPQNLHMSKLRTFSRRAAPEDGGSPPPARRGRAACPSQAAAAQARPRRCGQSVAEAASSLSFLLHWARERLEGAQASTSTGKRKTVGRLSRFPQDQLKKAGESTAPLYARSR